MRKAPAVASITAILTTYRRPESLPILTAALRAQSTPAAATWIWANEPGTEMRTALAEAKVDRVVVSSDNARFHGRFALALLASTEYVAIFDDDTIPGPEWFYNCLATIARTPASLGSAGVGLAGPDYGDRTMHGWQRPTDETVEVDLVGQAWFLRTEWVKHLFAAPAVTGTNGEDIELAARAWRLAGVRSYCPPHPVGDRRRWGSTRGMELGIDPVAASLKPGHLAERDRIVKAEIAAGWRPMSCRGLESGKAIPETASGNGEISSTMLAAGSVQ
jgi:hypothetical protein